MKNKIIKNKNKIILFSIWFLYTIIFFTHNIFMTWDSTEYLGMSLVLGTSAIKDVWFSVRGVSFPFLLRLFEPFGYQNKYMLLLLTYLFFMYLIIILFKIGQKLNLYQKSTTKFIYLFFITVFIILNPIIFMYYHTILTEFVAMTLNIVFVYTIFNYIKIDIRKEKKLGILTALTISLIITFLYHTKQSFTGMLVIELAIGLFLSFFRHFDIKNIMYKIFTCFLCALMLISSIKVWNFYMSKEGVKEVSKNTERYTSNKRIISGITNLIEVGNSSNLIYKEDIFKKTVQTIKNGKKVNDKETITIYNQKDKNEILKVLNNQSKYKAFTIYEAKNNEKVQYVFFTKKNYSMKEQIPFYFKIMATNPLIIINSYYDGIYKAVWKGGYYLYENIDFATYYYHKEGYPNVSYISPGYEFAVEDLTETQHISFLDHISFGLSILLFPIYRINQMIVPLLFLISLIITIYIIINNRKDSKYNEVRNGFEMITLMYGMSFGCIISYIMFKTYIDRYLVPSHIPMYLGDILFIIFIVKLIKLRKSKTLVATN